MKNFGEFQFTGRIGKMKDFDSALGVFVAANYCRHDDKGSWSDDMHWNEVVNFRQ